MNGNERLERLAQDIAQDHLRNIEFLSVVEEADERGLDLNDEDLELVHDLARTAEVVLGQTSIAGRGSNG